MGKQGQLQRQREGKVQGRQRQNTGNRFNYKMEKKIIAEKSFGS